MSAKTMAETLVKALQQPDGDTRRRPVHTNGIGVCGQFTASDAAARYCTAQHFSGAAVPVTGRFSNGSGCAVLHDGWSDVRGMAVRFDLPDGTATDLVAMTLPQFFASTPQTFLDFARAGSPAPVQRMSVWAKLWPLIHLTPPPPDPYAGERISPDASAMAYADANRSAQAAVFGAATIGAPVSYARASYYTVHTFIVSAPDGTRRPVRFCWQPVAGVLNTGSAQPPVESYL